MPAPLYRISKPKVNLLREIALRKEYSLSKESTNVANADLWIQLVHVDILSVFY